jgi:hypothetical protein
MRARKQCTTPSASNRRPAKRATREKAGVGKKSGRIDTAVLPSSAREDFGTWFAAQSGRLPRDFELDL